MQRVVASLEDRWEKAGEPVLLTGIQALVRLPLVQRQLDAAQGLDTAGFVSGYRGSPLGGLDKEMAKQAARYAAANIVLQPGLNEDLAATAVWGTQQVGLQTRAKHAGVFGLWYGKGPGVDRTGDVFRHANSAGTAPLGGVLALAGDDPSAKSSTVTNASEFAFVDLEMPVLDPAEVAEVLEFGLKGLALSRFAGVWAGMKCVADTMDAAASLRVDPAAYATVVPDFTLPEDGVHIRLRDTPLAQEVRLRQVKLPAAVAFARANGLDRLAVDAPRARLGIAARGKAFATLRQALVDCGVDDERARLLGLRVWKVGLAWPLDAMAARAFARGLETVLVVEDKRPLLEGQLREALYALDARPRILGKRDAEGRPLLSDCAELDAGALARALAGFLPEGFRTERMAARLAELDALAAGALAPVHVRDPFFCPGCPHNTSTRVPEGSTALAGIGCHYLVTRMDARESHLFTQMGGEGVPWLGTMNFVEDKHVFANLGDGTYAHSGSLAIRAALAAKANITFKLLVNSAVAMTGGQKPEGEVTVPRIAAQLAAEGVARIVIVADDATRHQGDPLIPAEVSFHDRSELDAVQRALRDTPGVTALIYDQECANERRRKRKRNLAPQAARRVAINPRVCEDCGDCSAASNCIAVEPIETPWGRKRAIDQSGCNQDYSCLKGFCPSFVTLLGAEPAQPVAAAPVGELPEPVLPEPREAAWNILLAGVGGQGVTALSAILAEAAHLEGRPVRSMDQLGLAQKGGGVFAQLRIGRVGALAESIPLNRIGLGQTDLLLSADLVVAHGASARPLLGPGRTVAVVNDEVAPTARFVQDTSTRYDRAAMEASLGAACREVVSMPAHTRVLAELGDAIFLNVFLLGVAYQRGLMPVSAEAIGRALELNGAAVARNREAFDRGRAAALGAAPAIAAPETLDALIARCADDLVAYQNAGYARRYSAAVARIRDAEAAAVPGDERLTRAVAVQLHRLMAYKDEYEVARLHHAWRDTLAAGFTGTTRVEYHLAPPLLAKRDKHTGLPLKHRFGPWMRGVFALLRHGKTLRGTALDVFGYTAERRMERALPGEFLGGLDALLPLLSRTTHGALCAWVEAWGGIRGFGHVKVRNLAAARERIAAAEAAMRAPAVALAAA